VVVTHDVRGAFRVADRIALLAQAKIRAVGTAEEIIASKDPVVQQFLERDLEMAVIQAGRLTFETPARRRSGGFDLGGAP
jgi:phospholipid/cholesterol/gamma-HCH transport system ATP-binding protein